MIKIRFTYQGFSFVQEMVDKGDEIWFGLKDRKGVWKDCLYRKKEKSVFVYGMDSDYLEEVCSAKRLA